MHKIINCYSNLFKINNPKLCLIKLSLLLYQISFNKYFTTLSYLISKITLTLFPKLFSFSLHLPSPNP